jgi:hypothetical protein
VGQGVCLRQFLCNVDYVYSFEVSFHCTFVIYDEMNRPNNIFYALSTQRRKFIHDL